MTYDLAKLRLRRDMEAAFVPEPSSVSIAWGLTYRAQAVCSHGRNPCVLKCGVRLLETYSEPVWDVVDYDTRRRWVDAFFDDSLLIPCANHGVPRWDCGCRVDL